MADVLNEIKVLEARGFSFEAAEASVAMLMKRQSADYKAPFELIDFLVNVEHRSGRGIFAEAMVKVRVNGDVLHTAAEGNGPVNALDHGAAQGADARIIRRLQAFHLADYKVRILDGNNGTEADHARADRYAERPSTLEHRRREHEHHRSELAGAGGCDRVRADGSRLMHCTDLHDTVTR